MNDHDSLVRRCVACGGASLRAFTAMPYFTLFDCTACRSLTALPRPERADLSALHDSSEYFDHPYFEQRRADVERARARCQAIGEKLGREALDSIRGFRHLDIGCDTGSLLKAGEELFHTLPVGIDVAARAVTLARAAGIEAYHSDLEGVPDLRDFGLVTIVDVIEHVPDPVSFMREVAGRMSNGAWCYVETPNIHSFVYRMGRVLSNTTGGRPAWLCHRLFLPEHVQYISDVGMARIAAAAGLELRAQGHRPLGFADVNSRLPIKVAVWGLQLLDRLGGTEVLSWAVLRKP